jgi:thioredoxin reductase
MDYLIVGAGPAGLQLGYFLERAGRSYRILEAGPSPGTFFHTFPRHKKLISINKRYTGSDDPERNLRTDWNSLLSDDPELRFTRYSERYFPDAGELVRYLEDFATRFRLRVQYDTRVAYVQKKADAFHVTDERGQTYQAARVIVATGVSKAYQPHIPGIEQAEFYATVSVSPRDFVNQRVLVIGKGNSAFETAENLTETAAVVHVAGPNPLKMAWKTHYVGHLRAVNNNFLDTYQLKSLNAILDGSIEHIERIDDSYLVTVKFVRANEIEKTYRYDRVIVCTGFRFDASIFDASCRPDLVHKSRFPAQTSAWESTNVRDLYFAGTLMQVRDFKKSTSGFIHGFRYAVRALHRVLEMKYHGVAWPQQRLRADPASLMAAVIARVNQSSALWQLFASMSDLIVVAEDGSARYCEEVPLDFAHESDLARVGSYFTVTLEYGPDHDQHDPFDSSVMRIAESDSRHADQGRYLHPVVRHYRNRRFVAEHHVTENLENDWTDAVTHREPLAAFFERSLGASREAAPLLTESA